MHRDWHCGIAAYQCGIGASMRWWRHAWVLAGWLPGWLPGWLWRCHASESGMLWGWQAWVLTGWLAVACWHASVLASVKVGQLAGALWLWHALVQAG